MEASGRTSGNRSAMRRARNGGNEAKTLPWVATSCRDPKMVRVHALHLGKEGVASLAPQKEVESHAPHGARARLEASSSSRRQRTYGVDSTL